MRTTLAAGAFTLGFCLTGALPNPVGAVPSPDSPTLTAECPELTGCVVVDPEPDPTVDPDLPGGNGDLVLVPIDPCLTELICPPEPDPELNPDLPPLLDDITVVQPCFDDLFDPCPGGGGGGGGGGEGGGGEGGGGEGPEPDPGPDPDPVPDPTEEPSEPGGGGAAEPGNGPTDGPATDDSPAPGDDPAPSGGSQPDDGGGEPGEPTPSGAPGSDDAQGPGHRRNRRPPTGCPDLHRLMRPMPIRSTPMPTPRPTAHPTSKREDETMPTAPTNPTRTTSRDLHRPVSLLALVVVTLLLLTGCGPGSGSGLDSGIATPAPAADPVEAALITEPWIDASTRAIVTDGFLDVFAAPGGSPVATLNPTTAFGTPRVLLVEEERDGWLRVRLPMRPNHRAGWVPADRVQVESLEVAVDVDLDARTLTVRRGDEVVLSTSVAVGSAAHPTPVGTFFITDKLETPDPSGFYGPFALGLSGFADLTDFAGGDGQIGIHGTNEPEAIGQAVSHGCIRVPNDVAVQLAELLPLGTPVHVV